MKTQPQEAFRRSEHGTVTVIFIILLGIMMILVTTETRALFELHRESKRVEQQQIKRLNNSVTNAFEKAEFKLK